MQNFREFIPLAVLAGGDDGFSLLFESLKDHDFRLQLGDGFGGCRLVDQLFFQVFLFVRVEVVVIFGRVRECFGECITAADAEFLIAQAVLKPLLASFERLIDRLRAGSKSPLQSREGETNRAFAGAFEQVSLAHLRLDVRRDGLVKCGLNVRERVVHRVRAALRKKRRAVEFDKLLFDHAAHEIGRVDFVHAVAEFTVEAIRVQQREEELKVFLLPVVRRCRHQQEMTHMGTQFFCEPESACRPRMSW